MGLFSDKKVLTVATQVVRVVDDKLLPHAAKMGVTKSLFRPDRDMVESILEEVAAGVGVKSEQLFAYGRDHYTYGLPASQIKTSIHGQEAIEAQLALLHAGATIEIEYSHYAPPNSLHIAWMTLVSAHGYNPDTNELAVLSAAKGTPVYMQDMTLFVPAADVDKYGPGSLDQWGPAPRSMGLPWRPPIGAVGALLAHNPIVVDPDVEATPDDRVQVFYTWKDPIDALHGLLVDHLDIPIADYDLHADYFHVKYKADGATKYFMYRSGAGTYPALDAIFGNEDATMGDFFPWTYFRWDKHTETSDKTSQAYKTSKKLVKYLGMNYDMVAKAIDENPDIADVKQAMMVFGVPPDSSDPIDCKYLFDFFNGWHSSVGTGIGPGSSMEAFKTFYSLGGELAKNGIIIQDSRFKMALSNAAMFKKRVAGSIGPVGHHTSAKRTDRTVAISQSAQSEAGTITSTWDRPVDSYVYRRQISVSQYDEIEVVNLAMLYFVEGGYADATTSMDDAEGGSRMILIPLDHSITVGYMTGERETLYARSLHFVFNSEIWTTLEWYQQDWFIFVMIIVAIVITVLDFGTDGGAFINAVLAGSSAAVIDAVVNLVVNLAISAAIGVAIKLFLKVVGVEIGIVIAVLAMAYGVYDGISAGGLRGAPWAQDLLKMATGLTQGIQAHLKDDMNDLLGEYQSFSAEAKREMTLLEDAQKLLENGNKLSPFLIFGESPNDFYNRTVHAGNVGAMGFTAISSYVDIALTLPKINDTLGESPYDS